MLIVVADILLTVWHFIIVSAPAYDEVPMRQLIAKNRLGLSRLGIEDSSFLVSDHTNPDPKELLSIPLLLNKLYDVIHQARPDISLGTVYRNLKLLHKLKVD